MNSIDNATSSTPSAAKRFVLPALIAMLCATLVVTNAESILNASVFFDFAWFMIMVALASFWLRGIMEEHTYIDQNKDFNYRPYLGSRLLGWV